jgi:D-lactate dehydrogenase
MMGTLLFVELDREWSIPLLERELGDGGWGVELRREGLGPALDALGNLAGEVEVLSPFIGSRIGAAELARLPSLRLLTTRSTGFDHIDLAETQRRDVVVCNVPIYGDNTVAEHTFALILSLSRKLRETYERVRRDEFNLAKLEGFDLRGKTLGLVGTGHIGLRVIQIARGFSMRVVAHDPRQQPLLADVLGFEYLPLDEVLARADIVSLHAPLAPATRHMINAETLSRMRRGALLINTARGGLVDTDALLEALRSGHLGGAGLDVLEHEGMLHDEDQVRAGLHDLSSMRAAVLNHMLLARDDVIFTPHLGFNSREANERIFRTTVENIRAFYRGAPQNVVQG